MEGKMLLSQAIKEFLVAMTAEGHCKRGYRDGMYAFLAHAGDVELNKLSTKTMRSFLASEFKRKTGGEVVIPDLLRRFYAVRTFITWLILQGMIREFDELKMQKKKPDLLMAKKIFRHSRSVGRSFLFPTSCCAALALPR
jgi:hypothetical protein